MFIHSADNCLEDHLLDFHADGEKCTKGQVKYTAYLCLTNSAIVKNKDGEGVCGFGIKAPTLWGLRTDLSTHRTEQWNPLIPPHVQRSAKVPGERLERTE